jgi:hypothetical protein
MSFLSAQYRRKAVITMTPQAKAAKDGPSFGIITSGPARGGPTCFAPQEAHSEELISRLSPQQGQIIESYRDFLFIVRVYEILDIVHRSSFICHCGMTRLRQ